MVARRQFPKHYGLHHEVIANSAYAKSQCFLHQEELTTFKKNAAPYHIQLKAPKGAEVV